MALSLFEAEQTIIFRITASRVEEQWQERTFVARILTRAGDGVEVTANKAGTASFHVLDTPLVAPLLHPPSVQAAFDRDQWKALPHGVAHSVLVKRSCVRTYKGQAYTGIANDLCNLTNTHDAI